MLVHLFSAAVNGLVATIIEIEVNTYRGQKLLISGLPDTAIRESYSRVTSAITNSGYKHPQQSIIINLAPANLRKEGTAYDLPIAIAMMVCAGIVGRDKLSKTLLLGELGLDGTLRPVCGCLPIAIEARARGFENLIVPVANVREAAVVDRLKVYGARHIIEVVDFLNGEDSLQQTEVDTRAEFYRHQTDFETDFSEVRGQESVKRAFEIAAAGGHNLLLIGSPGCGKSMMAKRMPTILPPLSLSESLETTQIHSVAGLLPSQISLISQRPFRSPHHTISDVALIGGGATFRPGEISLAHNGVLFLDELPEFSRSALETLRQPLEDRLISINRAKYHIELPCSFQLVAAMNPCPCGYYNDPKHRCECSPGQIKRYMNKISGPLLDRIDIQCEVVPLSFSDLSSASPGKNSAEIRRNVMAAREMQTKRFKHVPHIHCNAQMNSKLLHDYVLPDESGMCILRTAMERFSMSARAYEKILKVARTIADLEGCERVTGFHISEAVGYRSLDRANWGE